MLARSRVARPIPRFLDGVVGIQDTMYPLAVTITNALKNYAGYKGEMNNFPGGALSNVMNVNDGKAQFGISYSSAVTSSPEEMAENIGVEFRPGTKKYFQEKGWLK